MTLGWQSAARNEIAEVAKVQINFEETAVPVEETVRGACEILGFDPLYVANEGRFIALVPARDADRALAREASLCRMLSLRAQGRTSARALTQAYLDASAASPYAGAWAHLDADAALEAAAASDDRRA